MTERAQVDRGFSQNDRTPISEAIPDFRSGPYSQMSIVSQSGVEDDHRVSFVANAWESPSTLPMKNRDRLLRMTGDCTA